jgi:hypothetical protein
MTNSLSIAWRAVVLTTILSIPAAAVTVTKTTTFAPGIFWTHFTYAYTVTPAPGDCPCDDFEVTFNSLANIDKTTYAGPGSVAAPPPPPPANVMRVNALNPLGTPFTFSVQSVTNPTVVEGKETLDLTLAGVSVASSIFAMAPPPPNTPNPEAGAVVVDFGAGTFAPDDQVDLFQSTTVAGDTAHIGFGDALANGSAVITLDRPLTFDDLLIGEASPGSTAGTIVYETQPVPEPGTIYLTAWSLGIAAMLGRRRAAASRRKPSYSHFDGKIQL